MRLEKRLAETIFDIIEKREHRYLGAMQDGRVVLGGTGGSDGGIGEPPGGFWGQLIQTRVTYDTTAGSRACSAGSAGSSSLVDNLDKIRLGQEICADAIKDWHIDWGTGGSQVSAVDVPFASTSGSISATNVRDAIEETYIESGGGTGGGPANAEYVVMTLNPTLTAERVLTAGDGLDLTDGGAGGNATLAVDVTDILGNGMGEAANNIFCYELRQSDDGAAALTANAAGDLTAVGASLIVPDAWWIGQVAGPLITFDDTNNYLPVTGCKVGIGTTTPKQALDVRDQSIWLGTATEAPAYGVGIVAHPSSGWERGVTFLDSGDNVLLRIGAYGGADALTYGFVGLSYTTTWMVWKSGPLVGVGTTVPYSKLSISGSDTDPSLTHDTAALLNLDNNLTDLAITIDTSTPFTASIQHRHASLDGFPYPIAINPLGGNVGIGTPGPDNPLELLSSTTPQLRITHTDATDYATFSVDGDGQLDITTVDGAGAGGHICLVPDGNVGIKTTTPTADLMIGTTSLGTFAGIAIGATADRYIKIGQAAQEHLTIKWDYNATAADAYALIETNRDYNPLVLQPGGTHQVIIGATSPGWPARLTIYGPDTTPPSSLLVLNQADGSEEFINFVAGQGAGYPIQTGALGTYWGKVRVSVSGTFKYIALYDT